MGTRHHDDAVPAADSPALGELQSAATIDAAERELGTTDLQTRSGVTDAPPFWSTNRHRRTTSSASYQSLDQNRPAAIVLEDHSKDDDEQALSCWAQSVTIDDYSVVSGPSGIGAYVVWHCTVSTIKGGDMPLNKRYSEFDRLRENLVQAFPHADAMIPQLPRKSVVSRFRPKFLDHRKSGLAHFMNCILLNPEFASSPILKEFIFNWT
ncbi:Putative vacuolar protein sorting-associated protein [Septoria linicola]|uniref:Endosomal/vacuolar adapter protein YPT35 n=1 Tax=Septoria linicola TaxID=215465 RepID=A0A9Q9AWH6_9PEZI|nr:putative vacuolar protein sorting-associated protein [Septoria linicola]USW54458.1 Putative vacuolar protein sorting-associated protein [Septoria linicola]